MPERVVDGLETDQIEQNQADGWLLTRTDAAQLGFEALAERVTIEAQREGIGAGETTESVVLTRVHARLPDAHERYEAENGREHPDRRRADGTRGLVSRLDDGQ